MTEISKLIHLATAILWLGGMGAMILAVRPAVLALVQPPLRLQLMAAILRRFFALVWVSVALLFATGIHLYGAGAAAAGGARRALAASGTVVSGPLLPLGWHVMLGIGVVMFAIYGHIYFAGFKKLNRAVDASDMPAAAKALASIHPMIVANFTLGWIAIAAVKLL